jgi:hypothetical protein
MWKWIIVAVLVSTLIYVMIRPWLKAQPWAAPFFKWMEPIEIALYKKSETILFARLKMLTGVLLTLLTTLGTIDISAVLPFLPEKHRGIVQAIISFTPMLISVVGLMDERLRSTTTKPLELVALPENKPLPLAVEMAVQVADQAKVEAINVVKAEEKKV